MSINAINSTQITRIDRSLVTAKPAHAKSASDKIATAPQRNSGASAPSPEGPTKTEKGRAHGVLRLLAAGHFKATPEARLMAKFGHMLPKTEEAPTPDSPGVTPLTPSAEGVVADGTLADKAPVPLDARYSNPGLSGVETEPVTRSINLFA